jgi:hexokinase
MWLSPQILFVYFLVLPSLLYPSILFIILVILYIDTFPDWIIRDIGECKKLFKKRFDIKASDQDCEVIRRVCVAVSTRAARLAAAGVVALVKKIGKTDTCTVAVDGCLYKRGPFPERYNVCNSYTHVRNVRIYMYYEHHS